MIPKPPFACDLTLEAELAAFERLKPRLAQVWSALTANDDEACTSVVVPSMSLDQSELSKLTGASFYEERLLFLLIRLRNPRAHVVYVTSQPVHPMILDYYLNLLTGVPASQARGRLTMLAAYDSSARPLTAKILERPRLIQRIRYTIPDSSRAFLTVFNSTPLERKLSVLLDVPLNGLDPSLQHLGTKSGGRRVFLEAGVEMPTGFENLTSRADALDALIELRRRCPIVKRAVLKLNHSFSGEGNAVFSCPRENSRGEMDESLTRLDFSMPTETADSYFEKFGAMGGIVEEMVEGPQSASPSAQFRTGPRGEVLPISTHDQIPVSQESFRGTAAEIRAIGCGHARTPAERRIVHHLEET